MRDFAFHRKVKRAPRAAVGKRNLEQVRRCGRLRKHLRRLPRLDPVERGPRGRHLRRNAQFLRGLQQPQQIALQIALQFARDVRTRSGRDFDQARKFRLEVNSVVRDEPLKFRRGRRARFVRDERAERVAHHHGRVAHRGRNGRFALRRARACEDCEFRLKWFDRRREVRRGRGANDRGRDRRGKRGTFGRRAKHNALGRARHFEDKASTRRERFALSCALRQRSRRVTRTRRRERFARRRELLLPVDAHLNAPVG